MALKSTSVQLKVRDFKLMRFTVLEILIVEEKKKIMFSQFANIRKLSNHYLFFEPLDCNQVYMYTIRISSYIALYRVRKIGGIPTIVNLS